MSVVEDIYMKLSEIKSRHASRKLRDAPLHKILGPDATYNDLDEAIEMIDHLKEVLRDAAIYLRANPKQNDEIFDDLLNRIGVASE
jgi:hypothetical protein